MYYLLERGGCRLGHGFVFGGGGGRSSLLIVSLDAARRAMFTSEGRGYGGERDD